GGEVDAAQRGGAPAERRGGEVGPVRRGRRDRLGGGLDHLGVDRLEIGGRRRRGRGRRGRGGRGRGRHGRGCRGRGCRGRGLRRCGGGGLAGAGGDDSEDRADRDRLAVGDADLDEDGRRGSRDLDVDLVGGDLDQRLVPGDGVADLLEPPPHGALGDGLAHRGQGDLDPLAAGGGCRGDAGAVPSGGLAAWGRGARGLRPLRRGRGGRGGL